MTLKETTTGRELRHRYPILGGVILFGLLLLVLRLYRLQIAEGEEYTARSVANFVRPVPIPADRGMILDANGQILVDSRPSFDAFVTPAFCKDCQERILPRLGEILGWDDLEQLRIANAVQHNLRGPRRFRRIPVAKDLSRDELDRVSAQLMDLDGVEVQPVPHRSYRAGPVLGHLLGYMSEIRQDELDKWQAKGETSYSLGDWIGRRGVERSFESELRGEEGLRHEVVNARGQTIDDIGSLVSAPVKQPVPGNNLVLSIDYRLQKLAEQAFPGVAGAVVVVEAKTGFILALVSRPGFDPNLLSGRVTRKQLDELNSDPLLPMIFRATQNHYAPGSVFKVVTSLAALRSGQFSEHTHVDCNGGYRLGRRRWRCHRDAGHGKIDLTKAMKKSCDTWFYRVADVIGIDPIAEAGREFGLGAPTGIGVVREVPGIMPSEAYHKRATRGGYHKGMSLNTSIGQGDTNVTPLQMAMMYAAIGNGGTLHRPQLVRRVESVDGEILKVFEPDVVRKIKMTPEQRKAITKGLIAAVNEPGGTAYRSRLEDIVIAGKTGTAQTRRLGRRRLKTHQMDFWARDHAWFSSFAPAHDPEISVVVFSEHGGHGGSDAAPTAQALIKGYFELKNEVPPEARAPVQPIDLPKSAIENRPVPDDSAVASGGIP